MFLRIAQLASLIFTGLLAGLFAGRWLGAPASKEYSGPVFTEVQQRIDASVGQWAPGLIVCTIIALALVLVALRNIRSGQFILVASALLLVIAATVSTQVVNVPLNEEINGWPASSPPSNWTALRDRWESFHALRTGFSLLALILLASAVTVVKPRSVRG